MTPGRRLAAVAAGLATVHAALAVWFAVDSYASDRRRAEDGLRAVAGNAVRDEALLGHVLLGLHEAAANAVEHARPDGPVGAQVEITLREDDVAVVVRDDGRWHERVPLPDPIGEAERGRGLTLIHHVATGATIDRSRGTTIRMRFARAAPGSDPGGVPDAGALFRSPDPATVG